MDPYVIIVIGSVFVALTVTFADMSHRLRKAAANDPLSGMMKDRLRRSTALVATINKAVSLNKEGKLDQAIQIMEQWHATEPDLPDGDAFLNGYGFLGILYAARNQMDEAAPLLMRSLTFSENNPDHSIHMTTSAAQAHEHLARHYMIKGDFTAKQTHYRRAAERRSEAGERGRAARNWGQWYQNNGEYLVAAERFAEALAHPPADAEADYRQRLLVERLLIL